MRHFACLGAIGVSLIAACATGTPINDTEPDAAVGSVDAAQQDSTTTDSGSYETADSGAPDAAAVDSAADSSSGDAIADAPPEAQPEASADAAPEASADASADVNAPLEASVDAAPDAPTCTITSCGARSVCTTIGCATARRAFVSRATFTGALGGYAGADTTCQTLASAAMLGGTWMAWISDNDSSPSARFTQANVQYTLLDGTVVASNWAALTSGSLNHGIDEDENSYPVGGGTTEVWTATFVDGTLYEDGCSSFTMGVHGQTVNIGVSGPTDSTWTNDYDQFCDRTDHVYCIEQ
jgi:hypothetical protein